MALKRLVVKRNENGKEVPETRIRIFLHLPGLRVYPANKTPMLADRALKKGPFAGVLTIIPRSLFANVTREC